MTGSLGHIRRLILRRLPIVLLLGAIGAGIATGHLLRTPDTYTARALLLASFDQIDAELVESTVRTDDLVALQIVEQRILTRQNLLALAARLGGATGKDPDLLVRDMRSRTRIKITGGTAQRGPSQVLTVLIAFDAPDPDIAARGANEIAELIVAQNQAMRSAIADRTLDLLAAEADRLSAEMSKKGDLLAAFEETNIDALPETLSARQDRRDQLAARLDTLTDALAQLQAQSRIGDTLAQPAEGEGQIVALELEYDSLAAVYAPSHPRLVALGRQIEALRSSTTATGRRNETAQHIAAEDLADRIARTTAQMDSIRLERDALDTSIARTPVVATERARLVADHERARADLDKARSDLARAATGHKVEQLLLDERIETVEPATAPRFANGYGDRLVVLLSGIAGIGVGAFVVTILEYYDRTLRRPADIASSLGIEPIAAIPFLPSEQDALAFRIRRYFANLGAPA